MKIIAKPRQSGKTTKLIKLCYENNGTFVCARLDAKKQVEKKAETLKMPLLKVITINQLLANKFNFAGSEKFYFDNAEWILSNLVKLGYANIGAMTVSTDEK